MSSREPFEMVEVDVERCSLTFGTAPCTAALGGRTLRKCYQTKRTCADLPNFTPGAPLTLRFAKPGRLPKGVQVFPALESVRAQTATVNIAGSDPRMGALGKRGKLVFDLRDFAWHDRDFDRYQAERLTGAAQIDEPGYNPADRGTQLAKIKARWPNYSGAAVRYIVGYIDTGVIVDAQVRHYVLTAFDGPDDQGAYPCEATDILDLVSEKRALAPQPSNGVLTANITAGATSAVLTPVGIGAEYPASGRVVIGSEMCQYTRSGDTLTLTARGIRGTSAAAHNAGDTVQVVLTYVGARIDVVAADLIKNYTATPDAFVDDAAWDAEIDRWAPSLLLTTDITTPTSVGALLGELADLGVSIWWDDVAQKIGLKVNRPLDTDTLFRWTDRNIKRLRAEDRDEDRLTQVLFFTKRQNPTRGLTDEANYDRVIQTVDPDATAFYGGETRVRKVFTRWLDGGGDTIAALTSLRLLDRFRDAPVRYKVAVDARERDVGLTDVVELRSDLTQGVAGAPTARLVQVISRSDPVPGHEIEVEAQAFQFQGRFGFIAPNDAPLYAAATDLQKGEFAFASDGDNLFADGGTPYQII
jgi:hypothetical protein